MSTLFVDVDGTLIDEDPETGGDLMYWGVVDAVKLQILKHGDQRPVFVWSGGGADYARLWAVRLFGDGEVDSGVKEPRLLRRGDVVVDDMLEFKVPEGVLLLTPEAFVDWANE